MITRDEAIAIAQEYVKKKNREYIELVFDRVRYKENEDITYGKYEDQKRAIYTVPYDTEGYQYPDTYFILIDAVTGEVLYTLGGHGPLEIREL